MSFMQRFFSPKDQSVAKSSPEITPLPHLDHSTASSFAIENIGKLSHTHHISYQDSNLSEVASNKPDVVGFAGPATASDSSKVTPLLLKQDSHHILSDLELNHSLSSMSNNTASFTKNTTPMHQVKINTTDERIQTETNTLSQSPLNMGIDRLNLPSQLVNVILQSSHGDTEPSDALDPSHSLDQSKQLHVEQANTPTSPTDVLATNYERLKKKTAINDIYGLVSELEQIASSAKEVQQKNSHIDENKESWQSLLDTLQEFADKKAILKDIEERLEKTINEMRDIHLRIYTNLEEIKVYEEIRQANYAHRLKLAIDLEKKISLFKS
jgi:hypothetical protein